MLARVFTAATHGLDSIKIEVEVDGIRGKPNLVIIGLPSKSVDESKERITAALLNCGYNIRAKHTIVNLAPADLKKEGSTFELAIAIGLLKMYGDLKVETDETIFFGELSLDGDLKPIKGALPLVLAAKEMGFNSVFIPSENRAEVSIIGGIKIYPAKHLMDVIEHLQQVKLINFLRKKPLAKFISPVAEVTFSDIIGQEMAKRALVIAAAGGHNILLTGPPGAGKSLMAKALKSLLPPLTVEESLTVTSLYSISGQTKGQLVITRPFRSPHHSTSEVGLIGGGTYLKPGEISLAHHGVLFLDELPEFPRSVLEALRQPMEDGKITVSRASGSVCYPAQCMLVGAANPCPCGWHNTGQKQCQCTSYQVEQYKKRISGPILDRIDLHVQVKAVPTEAFAESSKQEDGQSLIKNIIAARQVQLKRYQSLGSVLNANLISKDVLKLCHIEKEALKLASQAAKALHLSARSYFKVLKVGRTIADLDEADLVESHHVAEALQYRQV